MNKLVNVKELFQAKISKMTKEQMLFMINFLTLYKIKKINRMPSRIFQKYLKNQSIQKLEITSTQVPEYKQELIENLCIKLEKTSDQDCFVLRNELNSYLSVLDIDTKLFRELDLYFTANIS